MNHSTKQLLDEDRTAIAAVDRRADELIELSDRIHSNPELGFEEHKAVRWISEKLAALGFRVERGVAGLDTAFRAVFRGSGDRPNLGFVVEYDALPGLGHACGHNTKGPATIGSVAAILEVLPSIPGTITVIGTPAEEGGGGKVIMAEAGVFGGLDMSIALSVGPKNMTGLETLASREVGITIRGLAAHAHAQPHKGRNALSALISGFNQLNSLRQQFTADMRVNGIITNGGETVGAIPAEASASFMISTAATESQAQLQEMILGVFTACAEVHGCSIDTNPGLLYREMKVNRPLVTLIEEKFRALGLEVGKPSFGGGTGATDMGNVSQVTPSDSVWLDLGSEVMPHTVEYAEASRTEPGHRALLNGAKTGALIMLELLRSPDRLKEIREAFSQG
ncbi:MAG: M20 family metallopeptidase [Spirochaetales bacterium]|nr:M20 family metallopeptidase [Spirochaetales bacterium]